jgi:hypothetical protein
MSRRLLPALLGAAALGLLGVVAPEIFTGTFSDLGTFARVAGLVIALVAWTLAARRWVPHRLAGQVVAIVPVVMVAWVVLWPYLRPRTEVDQAFPVVSTTTTTATAPAITTTSATTASTTTTTPTTTTTTVLPEPIELRRASFQGLTGHRGSGDVTVYRLADESLLLRFEDVDIGSGPDLEVYLVPGEDQRSLTDAIHVAELTAERGNQNYTLPEGVDLSDGTWTVLVWCETFDLEVANATLT